MSAVAIGENIFYIGAQHPERQLFDCLMPTPLGTTYNSYLLVGEEKAALIDTVDPEFTSFLTESLEEQDVRKIDYVVILHTEQDHSGSIHALLRRFPGAQLVATDKVAGLMSLHLGIPAESFLIKDEGEILDLGGKRLRFHKIPFAHWPDNTMAYEEESGILFSNDLFGSHFASGKVFSTNGHEVTDAAKAYFAEIMMPFTPQVKKYTEMVTALNPHMIAPSHGPIWNEPSVILKKYQKWTGDRVSKAVVIPYVSMHGSTHAMVERLALRLAAKGVSVICRDLGATSEALSLETGHAAFDLVNAAAVVFASPTVLGGLHPAAAYCATVINALKPKTRFVGYIGSWAWGSKAEEGLFAATAGLKKAQRLTTVMCKGHPTQEDFDKLDLLADELTEKISELGEGLL